MALYLFFADLPVIFLFFACVEIRKLNRKIHTLEDAIRDHRDARGNDRCWLDDEKLYRHVPDHTALTVLPEKEVFLGNCARFHANRQHPYHLSLFKDQFNGGASDEGVMKPNA